jgi:Zn-dependent protease with chaperone function
VASSTSTSGSEPPAGAARALHYDGRGAAAREVLASIVTGPEGAALSLAGADGHIAGQQAAPQPFTALRIGERVGGARRFVELPDGASLEVLDNDVFDALLEAAGHRTQEHGVGRLERHWRPALGALLALVGLSYAFLRFGAPLLANRAVSLLPPAFDARVGAGSLDLLDRSAFEPSALPQSRQAQLQRAFAAVAEGRAPRGITLRLELRGGGRIGANALALPDGTIVLTDELEALARHDDELRAVFAHEIGHVVGRHAMRKLLQQSTTALLAATLLGDVGSATVLVTAAPTVLLDAAYSRDFEREADAMALRWMAEDGIAPRRLGDLLVRLAAQRGGAGGGYLSTHPDLEERVRAGQAAASGQR